MSHRQIHQTKQTKYPPLKMAYKPFPAWIKVIWWLMVIIILSAAVYYAVELIVKVVHLLGG